MDIPLEKTRLRLDSLIEINQLLMSTIEPDAVLRVILDSAVRLFLAEASSIALIDPDKRQLAFVFSTGRAQVDEFRIDMGSGIAGWVAQSGEGVVCNDVTKDSRFFDGIDRTTGFTTKSLLCAPLKQAGQIIGVIQVLSTANQDGFTADDLQFLTAFGGLAGTAMDRATTFVTTKNANAALQETIHDHYRFIIGKNEAFEESLHLARSVAPANTTVLLLGESGTGKEIIARSIHEWSPRASHPFVAVNCVALTPELMGSELFGHEKGAFTGAIAQKKGRFELAEGGTLFLDEIGDLSPTLQTKLLRVLQEKEFQRVGGTKTIRTHVRILAATNRDLRQAIQTGQFREDLYYRLNVVSITMPPLRDRQTDIPDLVNHFISHYCQEVKRSRLGIAPSALDRLMSYRWPGNIRELQNAIERAVVLSPGPDITETDFPVEIRSDGGHPSHTSPKVADIETTLPLAEAVDHFKRVRIRKAMEIAGGNQAEAAKALGIERSNLSRLLKSIGLR